MRHVLVPFDGTRLAASIIPDAVRLAGAGGEIVLVYDVVRGVDASADSSFPAGADVRGADVEALATSVGAHGVTLRTKTVSVRDPAEAVDRAVAACGADIVACATHGRGPLGRLVHGSVAWRAMVKSPVPFLLRHARDDSEPQDEGSGERRIMVPLDGSAYAEKALPLAEEMAREWNAQIHLVQVVPGMPASIGGGRRIVRDEEHRRSQYYVEAIADTLSVPSSTSTEVGPVADTLVSFAMHRSITDVVMTSRGRDGLARFVLGSVADELVQRLAIPIIVMPSLAAVASRPRHRLYLGRAVAAR